METVIDWSKAPEGAEAAHPGNEEFYPAWYRRDVAGLVEQTCPKAGVNTWSWMGGRRDFPHGSLLRPHSGNKPWTGEGLPPVGTVCEINHPTMDWVRCEIVAHKVMDCGGKTHAIAWIDGDTLDQSQGLRFRPIRTPEQIEADERAAGIQALKQIFDSCSDELMPTSNKYLETLFGAIHDAGYRKQATQ